MRVKTFHADVGMMKIVNPEPIWLHDKALMLKCDYCGSTWVSNSFNNLCEDCNAPLTTVMSVRFALCGVLQ